MTTSRLPAHLPARSIGQSRRILPEGWPLLTVLFGFGGWWVLGLSNFIWIAAALPMLAALLMQRRLVVPRGFFLWLLFLAVIVPSLVEIGGSERVILWSYRYLTQVAATIALVYGYTRDPETLPAERITAGVTALWFLIVGLGLASMVAPTVEFPSLMQLVLPAGLLSAEYVQDLVVPTMVQIQDFLGFPVARPAAPFPWTNQWGANLALTTPMAFLWTQQGGRRRRLLMLAAGAVALVPAIYSLNRGLWVAVTAGIIYTAVRYARRGDVRGLLAVIVGMILMVVILLVTPLGELVSLRSETGHSDRTRTELYTTAIDYARDKPLTGHGTPIEDPEVSQYTPPIGTHGQVWYLLVAYGIPAAVIGFAILGWVMIRTSRAPPGSLAFWTNIMFMIAALEMFFYSLLPTGWPLLMAVAGVALRDVDRARASRADAGRVGVATT